MIIYPGHFQADLPRSHAQEIFKQSVQNIEVAISSYCNRQCSYCPNSKVDRIKHKHRISDEIFFGLLNNLKEIDYSAGIRIHRYNEPLADRSYALKRIKEIRTYLPNARVIVISNGDFVDKRYIQALCDLGVAELGITIHNTKTTFDREEMSTKLAERMRFFGFDYQLTNHLTDQTATFLVDERLAVSVQTRDFYARDSSGKLDMSDRGQSLDVKQTYARFSPCFMPFYEVQIDYDGSMWPCCNFHSDVPEHQQHKIGQLGEGRDLFAEWTNSHYSRWRSNMFSYDLKPSPCNTCDYMAVPDTAEQREQVVNIRRSCGLPVSSPAYDDQFFAFQSATSNEAARRIVPLLFHFFKPASAVDFGCGAGWFLRYLKDFGTNEVFGLDGFVPSHQLAIDAAEYRESNLAKPTDLARRFEMVISLEVAEHLPANAADIFVASLAKHSDLVIFSAAVPHQGGLNHVNEQWPTYWIEKFARLGYRPFDLIRPIIWNDPAIPYWYKNNIIVFANDQAIARHRVLAATPAKPSGEFNIVHPDLFLQYAGQGRPGENQGAL